MSEVNQFKGRLWVHVSDVIVRSFLGPLLSTYYKSKQPNGGQPCRYTPIILEIRMVRQEDHDFEAILSYILRPCLK